MTSLLSYFTPQNTPFLYRGTHFPFFFFWRVLPRIDPVATLSYLSPSTSTTQSSLESTMENKEGGERTKRGERFLEAYSHIKFPVKP